MTGQKKETAANSTVIGNNRSRRPGVLSSGRAAALVSMAATGPGFDVELGTGVDVIGGVTSDVGLSAAEVTDWSSVAFDASVLPGSASVVASLSGESL